MQYIRVLENGQMAFTESDQFLKIPSKLFGFKNTKTEIKKAKSGKDIICFYGEVEVSDEELLCPNCNSKMHIHAHPEVSLRHLPYGDYLTCLIFGHNRFYCPKCKTSKSQFLSFKSRDHRITEELEEYVKSQLAQGTYTNKQIAERTGLGKNTVKAIDKKRLLSKYTVDGKTLKKPERITRFLGIDEFKLHDGHRYATHIIDLETGHILWIRHGKKKQVVYDFIEHVGMEWMENVEAVACDMNSDFQEAFEERCEWLQPVFDHFHIVKNFNDKVVTKIRLDEQKRLYKEGNIEAAQSLKRTKYILTSNRKTLKKKDNEAKEDKVISKGSTLFNKDEVTRTFGYESKYDQLLEENALLFTLDLIKEKLSEAYRQIDEPKMADMIINIMDICLETENPHFLWFYRLLDNHFEGIIAHATYRISNSKIEGINNRIKTLRRQGYGYPDDEYFFLKIMDASRVNYERNPKSHSFCD